MTRREVAKTSAVGITPPATDPHAPVEITAVDRVGTNCAPACQSRADSKRYDLSVAIDPLSGCRLVTPRISRKSKSP